MKGDFIFVKDLAVKCVSGKDGWSRAFAQPVLLNLAIGTSHRLRHLALSDDIRRTLNYDSLSTTLINRIESRSYANMQETAVDALRVVQQQISRGEHAVLRLQQPKSLLQARGHEIVIDTRSNIMKEQLHGLSLRTIIGINELERERLQTVKLDISIERPLRDNGKPFFTGDIVEKITEFAHGAHMLTIESFVNYVASEACGLMPTISSITVRAAKPNALNMAAEAAVQVTRSPSDALVAQKGNLHTVYLAFGTNQGDRIRQIQQSVQELRSVGVDVIASSNIFQSDPKYFTDQPQFFNGVFKCTTKLSPLNLLAALKEIEYNRFSRVKAFDNGPRTFDLDIILYDNEYIESETLTVPHRDMLNRSFVLRPLNELLPKEMQFPVKSDNETIVIPLHTDSVSSPQVRNYIQVDPYTNTHNTHMMAILNVTLESFSDGGVLADANGTLEGAVVEAARIHIANGATILDIGGHSTRPGAPEVSVEAETANVCTAVSAIRRAFPSVVISVDTFRGSVARSALNAGANIINDVYSGMLDPTILSVAAEAGAPLILSHSRGDPQTMSQLTDYPAGLIDTVAAELRSFVDAALRAGCQPYQLILDPGLGFAKTSEQDLELVRRFSDLKSSAHLTRGLPRLPWLVGPSRKSFIGKITGSQNARDRLPGTLATIGALRQQGLDLVRVHDTASVSQALKVLNAVYKY